MDFELTEPRLESGIGHVDAPRVVGDRARIQQCPTIAVPQELAGLLGPPRMRYTSAQLSAQLSDSISRRRLRGTFRSLRIYAGPRFPTPGMPLNCENLHFIRKSCVRLFPDSQP